MIYEPKNFDALFGTPGFSDRLLKDHFLLYQAYVKNTNKLLGDLHFLSQEGRQTDPHYAELKRRFGWEWNGMRLHEYYFDSMRKGGSRFFVDSELGKKIAEDFGSFEAWQKDFKATGAMRGIGWVALYCDLLGNRLFNVWIGEHDAGHLSGSAPVLIMDVFEHAFMTDYGTKKADYIAAFFDAIHWEEAQRRYDLAVFQESHARK